MITEYYFKTTQAGDGYNYTVKFYIDEQPYCAEGFATTRIECFKQAELFLLQMQTGVKA